MIITVEIAHFDAIVAERSRRHNHHGSLIAQIKEVIRVVRRVCPEDEIRVMMWPLEYFRLENRAGGWGEDMKVPGFEMVGTATTAHKTFGSLLKADHVWIPELNARFYPDFETMEAEMAAYEAKKASRS